MTDIKAPFAPASAAIRAALALALAVAAGPALAADGKALFDDQCAACHSLGPASTASGPSLKGVVWRKIAALPDFPYSAALKSHDGSWTPARLDAFLKDTQASAPHAGMFFAIQDPADRQALVTYLKSVP